MDRPAPKPAPSTPRPQAGPLRADQTEVYDGLLLALLARKRLLVLTGEAGSGRARVFGQLLEHVASDGGLVLPVAGRRGAGVEELITEAGNGVMPSAEDRDFEALIEELEERLDLAGYGLLAVEQAQLLTVETLEDLVELSRSETPAGRALQIMLCGTPELEHMLTTPDLAAAVRDGGVIYRLAPGAAPSVNPLSGPLNGPLSGPLNGSTAGGFGGGSVGRMSIQPDAEGAAPMMPTMRPAPRPVPSAPEDEDSIPAFHADPRRPANDGIDPDFARIDDGWPPPDEARWVPPQPRRRLSPVLLAGAALTTLVLVGAGIAVTMPDSRLVAQPAALVQDGWNSLRGLAERTIGGPFAASDTGAPSADRDPLRSPVAALPQAANPLSAPTSRPSTSSAVPAPAPAPAGGHSGTSLPDGMPPAVAATKPDSAPASIPAAPPATVAALPPEPVGSPATTPPRRTGSLADPETATPDDASSPETSTAVLPPLEDPPNAGGLPDATTQERAPGPEQAERVRALVEEARRQIAAKNLTTPAGDNAYETVRRLRALAPNTPEIQQLLASMEETYRRWAAFAEQKGDFGNARHFYERALIVAPGKEELRERIESSDKREAEAQSGPSAVKPGLDTREAAVALLRQPAALRDALNTSANVDARVGDGKTLLMLASEQGLTDAVRALLQKRARADLRTGDGATAIMYAAWGGHDEVVKSLAGAGAELDATNADGKTALMAAAARGHAAVVRTLLERGVSVDRATGHGWTALMYAANNGHERIVRMLVDRGANPFRMDNDGNSALTLGALQGHVQVVELLKPR